MNGQGASRLGASTTGRISWQGGTSETLSVCVWFDDDGLGWMGRSLLAMGARCMVLGAGRVSIEKGTFWVFRLAGWAGLGCVSVWVIAAGQERSPVHGDDGPRLIEEDARCQMPAARGSSIPRPAREP